MGKFKATFGKVMRSKNTSQFADRLPDGIHIVLLTKFQPKNSDKELGVIVESEFIVESTNLPSSTDPKEPPLVGGKRGWPWFIEQKGWGGTYEADRNKKFIATCGECLSSEEDLNAIFEIVKTIDPEAEELNVESLGDMMSDDSQPLRGIRLKVEVTPKMKDGVRVKDSKGKPLSDAEWSAIPTTLDEIFAQREKLDAALPAAHPNAPGEGTAPHPAAAVAPAQATRTFGAAKPAVVATPVAPPPPQEAPKSPAAMRFMKSLGK